jgi:hypothetical protein
MRIGTSGEEPPPSSVPARAAEPLASPPELAAVPLSWLPWPVPPLPLDAFSPDGDEPPFFDEPAPDECEPLEPLRPDAVPPPLACEERAAPSWPEDFAGELPPVTVGGKSEY